MDRIAGIERSAAEEEAEREFEERVEAKRKECEERTLKNAEVCGARVSTGFPFFP